MGGKSDSFVISSAFTQRVKSAGERRPKLYLRLFSQGHQSDTRAGNPGAVQEHSATVDYSPILQFLFRSAPHFHVRPFNGLHGPEFY